MNIESPLFAEQSLWVPVLIFLGRVTDVSLGTVRLICVTRGRRALAVGLGFLETMIWILAISGTFAHLDHWVNILAYCSGFATGNAVGMWIERTLAMGTQIVQFISRSSAQAVAEGLRFAGSTVTTLLGQGRDGPVAICIAIVPRRRAARVIAIARQIDPDVLITIEDATQIAAKLTAAQCPDQMPSVITRRLHGLSQLLIRRGGTPPLPKPGPNASAA